MAKVVAVTNSKGGVGKTTTALNLAAAYQSQGAKVVLVDHDTKQASAARWLEESQKLGHSHDIKIYPVRGGQLSQVLEDLGQIYDVIVIDGPPNVQDASTAMVATADLVLIPVRPNALDLWSCERVIDWIVERRSVTGGKPEARFLLSQVPPSSKREAEVAREKLSSETTIEVLNEVTSSLVGYSRVMEKGITVFDMPSSDRARKQFTRVFQEIDDVLN